ncbi:putative thioredoxin-like ferredoxin [Helianthus annuus]|nr:putative thioredoxin-like ferredoxin [Helianthus annuus]
MTFYMLEKDDFPLPKVLAGALKARKNDIHVKTLLTISEGREGTELSDGDVLLFPEMIKYG